MPFSCRRSRARGSVTAGTNPSKADPASSVIEHEARERQLTAVVTGVGALIGQGIIRSLRLAAPHARIIGVDRSDDSPGPDWCDEFHKKPPVTESDPAYTAFWRGLLTTTNADIVFPGIDVDCWFLADRGAMLPRSARLVINSEPLNRLCRDKWAFYEAIQTLPGNAIPTLLASTSPPVAPEWQPPFVVKHRFGSGSRGMSIARSHEELAATLGRIRREDFIVQPYIGTDDAEFTAAAFGLGDGSSGQPIVFRRRLSPAGNTAAAVVVTEPEIEAAIVELSRTFRPVGPTNYQFRKDGAAFRLLEINPRLSSSSSLRTLFGFNEVAMCLEFFIRGRPPAHGTIRRGRAWRYLADHVAYDRDSV